MDNQETNNRQILIAFTIGELILFIMFIVGISYIYQYVAASNSNKQIYEEISSTITNEQALPTESELETPVIPENVQKVISLKEENQDVVGWIQIDDTIINYPVLQSTTDKDYYLTHNYKKEKSKYGSIYLNQASNLTDTYSNSIIYGHNMKDEQMFNSLLKYQNKVFYDEHSSIKVATENEENEYTIVCVFKSKVFYQDDENVFRYYQYTNLDDEKTYNNYINNCKKIQLYDTGITANYGEQLITLTTCEYSQDNGRFVIVAKKVH